MKPRETGGKVDHVFETFVTSRCHWLAKWGEVNNSFSCKGSDLICEDEPDKLFMITSYTFKRTQF